MTFLPDVPKMVLSQFQAIFCQKVPRYFLSGTSKIDVVSLYSLTTKGFPICELLQCPLNLLWLLVTLRPPSQALVLEKTASD